MRKYYKMTESKYLIFEEQKVSCRKLPKYIVKNRTTGYELAEIRFCGAWRKYVLKTYDEVIFDANCLSDIIIFLNDKTAEWRASLKKGE